MESKALFIKLMYAHIAIKLFGHQFFWNGSVFFYEATDCTITVMNPEFLHPLFVETCEIEGCQEMDVLTQAFIDSL